MGRSDCWRFFAINTGRGRASTREVRGWKKRVIWKELSGKESSSPPQSAGAFVHQNWRRRSGDRRMIRVLVSIISPCNDCQPRSSCCQTSIGCRINKQQERCCPPFQQPPPPSVQNPALSFLSIYFSFLSRSLQIRPPPNSCFPRLSSVAITI